MPADFEKCRMEGGKIRTMKVGEDKYAHVCIDKMGKSHMGEVKMKKEQMPDKPMMKS